MYCLFENTWTNSKHIKYRVDKDADGRVSEEEVREIISLSASANKLSNIQKQADEYAALIMEELDPDNLGYIMVHIISLNFYSLRVYNVVR